MPRAKRVCAKPGCPKVTDVRLCPLHQAEAEKARGTTSERGYGSKHQALRTQWAPKVEAGLTNCSRCSEPIKPGTQWALDHSDDRQSYLGPAHKQCNDAAGGKATHAKQGQSRMIPSALDRQRMIAERDALKQQRDNAKPTAMANVTLVSGPPCSGKTTYVAKQREHGDLVIDYDAIAVALGSTDTHEHPASLHPFILHTIDSLLERVKRTTDIKVWLIKCQPTTRDLAISSTHTRMTTDQAECKQRATQAGRPAAWQDHIDNWFKTNK